MGDVSMKKRVVITGIGVLSPIGSGSDAFWHALCEGTNGIEHIRGFDTSMFDIHHGGEVRDMDPAAFCRVLNPQEVPRTTQLAIAAARMAAEDAGLEADIYPAERVGVCVGTTIGNSSVVEYDLDRRMQAGSRLSPLLASRFSGAYLSAAVAEELGSEGPALTVPTACAAGNYAIGWGRDLIMSGEIDAAVVGGSDAISRTCYTIFYRLGAIAPERCQPFDKNRKGMLVSEGSAMLVLEDYDSAVRRGARIYAELLGTGLSCDAHHLTAPHPEGYGAVLAIERALADAGLTPQDVTYISAHGTGTKANDATESMALRTVFGERADSIPTSSIKSMFGHTMGAASAIEAVTCALAIYHGVIPPTMNYETADEECVQAVVPNNPIRQPVRTALSNSFAFGGNISILLFGGLPS